MAEHQKHTKLTKPNWGKYGCKTLSLMGGDPHNVKKLVENTAKKIRVAWIKNSLSNDFSKEVVFYSPEGEVESRFEYRSMSAYLQLEHLFWNCQLIFEADSDREIDGIIVFDNQAEELPEDIIAVCGGLPSGQTPYFSKKALDRLIDFIYNWLKKQMTVPLYGLVLVGGKSSRMQRDKSSLHYHDKNQREIGYQLLKKYCSEVFLSCRSAQSQFMEHQHLEDNFLNLGPLGGIMTAQQYNPNVAWLVIACDLPLLSEETIKFLKQNRNPLKIATVFKQEEQEFPEPMVSIWEPRAYRNSLHYLSKGYSCPRKVLINSTCQIITPPAPNEFMNVNTPQEYRTAKKQLKEK
jgi:molybdopterin-guanine dinucleotide biosynthesis protein A